MPGIGERNAINPIWPTKPGERAQPRKRPKPPEEKQNKEQNRQEHNKSEGHPRVDDYA